MGELLAKYYPSHKWDFNFFDSESSLGLGKYLGHLFDTIKVDICKIWW